MTNRGWLPSSYSPTGGTSPRRFLYAFDLLELEPATDLRREPIEVRKATLASILRKAGHGVRLKRAPGAFRRRRRVPALEHGLEGIVSKRLTRHLFGNRWDGWVSRIRGSRR